MITSASRGVKKITDRNSGSERRNSKGVTGIEYSKENNAEGEGESQGQAEAERGAVGEMEGDWAAEIERVRSRAAAAQAITTDEERTRCAVR